MKKEHIFFYLQEQKIANNIINNFQSFNSNSIIIL